MGKIDRGFYMTLESYTESFFLLFPGDSMEICAEGASVSPPYPDSPLFTNTYCAQRDITCEDLPDDILGTVFGYLDPQSLGRVGRVSKLWRRVSGDNTLWRPLLEAEYSRRVHCIQGLHPAFVPDEIYRQEYVRYRRILFNIQRGDFNSVTPDAEFVVNQDQGDAFALQILGGSCQQLGRLAQAIVAFNASLELDPKNVTTLLLRAKWHLQLGRLNEGLQDLYSVLSLEANNLEALICAGDVLCGMGRYVDAYPHLMQAAGLNSEDPFIQSRFAEVLCRFGRYEEALDLLNKVLAKDPDCCWALSRRGDVRRCQEDLKGALEDLNRAIDLSPHHDVFSLSCRGEVQCQLEFYEAADQDLTLALQLDPRNLIALRRRGKLRNRRGFPSEALQDLEAAYNLEPENLSVLLMLGKVKRALGLYSEAAQHFGAALIVDPSNQFARESFDALSSFL